MSPQQASKRSQVKKIAAPARKRRVQLPQRAVPLPLEVVFIPDPRGAYDASSSEAIYGEDGSDPHVVRFDFMPTTEQNWPRMSLGQDSLTPFYGRWGTGPDDLTVPWERFRAVLDKMKTDEALAGDLSARLISEEYMEWRSLVRAAMTCKMTDWPKLNREFPQSKVTRLCQPLALAIEWRNGRPHGIITCTGILQALIATLHIDAVIGAEYRFCACVGCTNSFKVKRKDQRYCDDDCKHRQTVRDGRERQRKAAEQLKAKAVKRRTV